MKSIGSQPSHLPPTAPVMFLQTVMMPHVMLPLFIFEPRYRAMLQHCVEDQRMFCVALMRPGVQEVRSAADHFPIAGIGLLRACVGHPDGTSHLVLQGLARVRLEALVQEEPFRVAEMRELQSTPSAGTDHSALTLAIREECAEMLPCGSVDRETLSEQIAHLTDPGTLCDVAAHTFLRSPYLQQEVLEELSVARRLELTLRYLRAERGAK